MSTDRRKPVAAVLALLGVLCLVAALVGTGVHYARLSDAAVGTPPGSSALDRAAAGLGREASDAGDRALGRTPEAHAVEAPEPETTFDASAPDTFDDPIDLPGAVAEIQGRANQVSAPSEGMRVDYAPSAVQSGALVLPEAPGTAWYDQTAPVGSPGSTLIAGHVNFSDLSLSPFSRIAGLEKGTPILVTDAQGTVHEYAVDSLQVYEQQALPQELFSAAGPDRLVLVTCSGASISTGAAWSYEYNLVVTARAA